jgi:hypothetical protein
VPQRPDHAPRGLGRCTGHQVLGSTSTAECGLTDWPRTCIPFYSRLTAHRPKSLSVSRVSLPLLTLSPNGSAVGRRRWPPATKPASTPSSRPGQSAQQLVGYLGDRSPSNAHYDSISAAGRRRRAGREFCTPSDNRERVCTFRDPRCVRGAR